MIAMISFCFGTPAARRHCTWEPGRQIMLLTGLLILNGA
jgi:hypothetical protein